MFENISRVNLNCLIFIKTRAVYIYASLKNRGKHFKTSLFLWLAQCIRCPVLLNQINLITPVWGVGLFGFCKSTESKTLAVGYIISKIFYWKLYKHTQNPTKKRLYFPFFYEKISKNRKLEWILRHNHHAFSKKNDWFEDSWN